VEVLSVSLDHRPMVDKGHLECALRPNGRSPVWRDPVRRPPPGVQYQARQAKPPGERRAECTQTYGSARHAWLCMLLEMCRAV
jgi:hypothetical protein